MIKLVGMRDCTGNNNFVLAILFSICYNNVTQGHKRESPEIKEKHNSVEVGNDS